MLPIAIKDNSIKIALIGRGELVLKRLSMLKQAGIKNIDIFSDSNNLEEIEFKPYLPNKAELKDYSLIYIADLPENIGKEIAEIGFKLGKLVNFEDKVEYCNFYNMSMINRGDLSLAISTAGKSPALSVRIRKILENLFPIIWQDRLEEIANLRENLKQQKKSAKEINAQTNQLIDKNNWL